MQKFPSSFCSLFVLGATGCDGQPLLWSKGGHGLSSHRVPMVSGHDLTPSTGIPVFIKPYGDMHDGKYWMGSQSKDDHPNVVAAAGASQVWFIRSRDNRYHIESAVGANSGAIYLSSSSDTNSDEVKLQKYGDDGNALWDFQPACCTGVYNMVAPTHKSNLKQGQNSTEDSEDDEFGMLRGHSRRRRGSFLTARQGGERVELFYQGDLERAQWQLELAACPVLDSDKITGSWHPHFEISSAGPQEFDYGVLEYTKVDFDWDFKLSLKEKMKGGLNLGAFKTHARISAAMSASLTGHYESLFITTHQNKYTFNFTSDDVGKHAWQFKIVSVDVCGQTTTTWTSDFAMTHGDPDKYEPCCQPNKAADGAKYNKCYKKADMMPGAQDSSHCKSQDQQYSVCATEGETCSCTGDVLFGRQYASSMYGPGPIATWSQMLEEGHLIRSVKGSIECSSGGFGKDPTPNYVKQCMCAAEADVVTV